MGLAASSMISSAAIAGGFDRGGVNIDLLFDERRFASEAGVTHVVPRRELINYTRAANNAAAFGAVTPAATASVKPDSTYTVPRVGMKFGMGDATDCVATYAEPYGADQENGLNNAASQSSVEFFIDTQDYGLTCSYQMGVGTTSRGDSFVRIIGGISYQELDGFLSRQSFQDFANAGIPTLAGIPAVAGGILTAAGLFGVPGAAVTVTNTAGLGTFDVSGNATGWRAGIAYEIPDIALRAVLLYHSSYDYDLSGVQNNTGFGVAAGNANAVVPISATTEIPQAVELKFQSGIAEGTLAFANFKWQDWSKIDIVPINGGVTATLVGPGGAAVATPLAFEAGYQDGYTVTAGIGKQLNENLSGVMALGWDRQTSTTSGTQTSTWSLSGGINYKDGENIDIRVGGLVGILEGGTSRQLPNSIDGANAATYSFDSDFVYAGSASIKYGF